MFSNMPCHYYIGNELEIIFKSSIRLSENQKNENQHGKMSDDEDSLSKSVFHSRERGNHSPFMAANRIILMSEHEG